MSSGASLLSQSKAYMGMLRSQQQPAAGEIRVAEKAPGGASSSAPSSPLPPTHVSSTPNSVPTFPPADSTHSANINNIDNQSNQGLEQSSNNNESNNTSNSNIPVEDDPEYQSLIQRGYKREQAAMIIKKKRSRSNLTPTSSFTSPSPSASFLNNANNDGTNTESASLSPGKSPATAASGGASRLMSFSEIPHVIEHQESQDDEHKANESTTTAITPPRPTITAHANSNNTRNAGQNNHAGLTVVQERSIQNLMSAGMSREDATIYVCSGASNMPSVLAHLTTAGNNSGTSNAPSQLPVRQTSPAPTTSPTRPMPSPAAIGTNANAASGVNSPGKHGDTPTAIAMSVAAPASSFLHSHNHSQQDIAQTPAVYAEAIDDEGSASGMSATSVSLSQVYSEGNPPPASVGHTAGAQYLQQSSYQPNHSNNNNATANSNSNVPAVEDEEDDPEDEEAMNERIQIMISEQREEFGICMYDVLEMNDEAPMRKLIGEGYRPEDAVRLIFERKGYVSRKPLPQPRRPKSTVVNNNTPTNTNNGNNTMNMNASNNNMYNSYNTMMYTNVPNNGMYPANTAPAMTPHHSSPVASSAAAPASLPPAAEGKVDDEDSYDDDDRPNSNFGEEDNHSFFDDDDDANMTVQEREQRKKNILRNKTELPQYRMKTNNKGGKGKGNAEEEEEGEQQEEEMDDNLRYKGSFFGFLRKKTLRKMRTFLGLPVGDHHLKRDKFGNMKSEDERIIQKKLRYRDADVQSIVKMGFTKEQAIAALASNKNKVNDAVNALILEADRPKSKSRPPQNFANTSNNNMYPGQYPPNMMAAYPSGYYSPYGNNNNMSNHNMSNNNMSNYNMSNHNMSNHNMSNNSMNTSSNNMMYPPPGPGPGPGGSPPGYYAAPPGYNPNYPPAAPQSFYNTNNRPYSSASHNTSNGNMHASINNNGQGYPMAPYAYSPQAPYAHQQPPPPGWG